MLPSTADSFDVHHSCKVTLDKKTAQIETIKKTKISTKTKFKYSLCTIHQKSITL